VRQATLNDAAPIDYFGYTSLRLADGTSIFSVAPNLCCPESRKLFLNLNGQEMFIAF
jgi:hypothetical protein